MRFLKRWLDTETPTAQRLLDAALVMALLPHVVMTRVPMLLYGVLVLVVLWRGREVSGQVLALFGAHGRCGEDQAELWLLPDLHGRQGRDH